MHFRGRERLSLDAKGRTSMPVRFRALLEENLPARTASQLVVVPWFEPCIRVFPLPLWEQRQGAFDARFGEMDIFGADEGQSDFRRLVYGLAIDVQLDATGRLLLSQDLREHARISREVYWVGLGPVLEIWDPETWSARMSGERFAEIRRQLGALRGAGPGGEG